MTEPFVKSEVVQCPQCRYSFGIITGQDKLRELEAKLKQSDLAVLSQTELIGKLHTKIGELEAQLESLE